MRFVSLTRCFIVALLAALASPAFAHVQQGGAGGFVTGFHGMPARDRHRDRSDSPLACGSGRAKARRRRRRPRRSLLSVACDGMKRGCRHASLTGTVALVSAPMLWPLNAHAHLISTGLGPVYDGIIHFALTPEDLIAALALALFAGLRGKAHARRVIFVLPLAWLVAGLLGTLTSVPPPASLAWMPLLLVGGGCRRLGFD